MSLENLITNIEHAIEHTDLFWLVRLRTKEMMVDGAGAYFAHICNSGAAPSYKGYGDIAEQALQNAYNGMKV